MLVYTALVFGAICIIGLIAFFISIKGAKEVDPNEPFLWDELED